MRGRQLLVLRLAWRDLRRRPIEAILALLVMVVATTTLTIGLALHGVTDHPYEQTRTATAGPDAVAGFLSDDGTPPVSADVDAVTRLPGVTAHGALMPMAHTTLTLGGRTATVQALGREPGGADPVDRPKLTSGMWVGAGSVVLERGFADALGAQVGDQVTLGGRSFRIGGTAVSAALPAYPSSLCHLLCFAGVAPGPHAFDIGLVWLAPADLATVHERTTPAVVYLLDLRLADPSSAPAFAAANGTMPGPGASGPFLLSWQQIRDADAGVTRSAQAALQVGAVLLALLAIAGLTVLAGRRTLEQTRRVGLLKAVGGTPGLIALVLLVEHLALAVLAAAAGLGVGRLLAGRFTAPGAGLLGSPGPASLAGSTVAVVVGAALLVALTATVEPALRAARSATITALEAPARTPRRHGPLIALSAKLPVPLLLGLRLIGRRPARAVLAVLSNAVAVTGLVAILTSAAVNARHRRAAQPAHRAADPGHRHDHGDAAGAGRGEHGFPDLGHRRRRPARLGAGPRVRGHPGPGDRRPVGRAGRAGRSRGTARRARGPGRLPRGDPDVVLGALRRRPGGGPSGFGAGGGGLQGDTGGPRRTPPGRRRAERRNGLAGPSAHATVATLAHPFRRSPRSARCAGGCCPGWPGRATPGTSR